MRACFTRRTLSLAIAIAVLVSVGLYAGRRASDPTAIDLAATPITGLHVSGNHIVDSNGQQRVLHGVSRWSLEFTCKGDGHFADSDFAQIASWGFNTVRFPTNTSYWLNGDGAGCTASQYQHTLDAAIHRAEAHGMYVIVVGQWSQTRGNSPMAYPQDRTMWQQLAATYGSDPQIGFTPVTEPHDVTWNQWLNGWNGGPGMQELVNIVRAKSSNLIFVSGLSWAKDLSFVTNGHMPQGRNLVLEVHPYGYLYHHPDGASAFGTWADQWASLAGQYPVFDGEVGTDSSGSTVPAQLTIFEKGGVGWAVWAWTGGSPPITLSGWTGSDPIPVIRSWAGAHPVPMFTFSAAAGPPGGATSTSMSASASTATTSTSASTTAVTSTVTSASTAIAASTAAAASNIGDGLHLPAMGWNHYNHYGDTVNEATITRTIDAMSTNGMRDAGYRFINVDDSWQGQRDASGTLQANANYPHGIAWLANYAHQHGFRFGIYDANGTTSCAGRTGARGKLAIDHDAGVFASWGVDYIKVDMCTDGWSDSVQTVATEWAGAIHATGRPMVLSLSSGGAGTPWNWAAAVGVNSYRIGDDICDAWTVAVRDNSRKCYRPPGGGLRTIITGETGSHLVEALPSTGPGHVPDPDMLEVGNGGLTPVEERTQMTVWSMVAAPLIAGNDPTAMDPTAAAILENPEVIAIDQDPLVQSGRHVGDAGSVQIWSRPLSGGGTAIALINVADAPANASVDLSKMGYGGRPVRDVWQRTAVSTSAPWSGTIPAHGSVLLRVGATLTTESATSASATTTTTASTTSASATKTATTSSSSGAVVTSTSRPISATDTTAAATGAPPPNPKASPTMAVGGKSGASPVLSGVAAATTGKGPTSDAPDTGADVKWWRGLALLLLGTGVLIFRLRIGSRRGRRRP